MGNPADFRGIPGSDRGMNLFDLARGLVEIEIDQFAQSLIGPATEVLQFFNIYWRWTVVACFCHAIFCRFSVGAGVRRHNLRTPFFEHRPQ